MCRSTAISRSAPAVLNRSAISRARDRLAAAVLLVLPGVAVERHDHGDPLGRGALERVDHDQLLHDPVVDRRGVALQHEGVAAAHRLLEADEDLAVGEVVGRLVGVSSTPSSLGDLLGQLGVGAPGEEHQVLLAGGLDDAHPSDLSSILRRRRLPRARLPPPYGCRPCCRATQPVDVALLAPGDGERAGRDVVGDRRSRRGVGAVADRRPEPPGRVAADEGRASRPRCGACRRRRSWRRSCRRRCSIPRRSSRRRRRTGAAPSRRRPTTAAFISTKPPALRARGRGGCPAAGT